MDRMNDLRKFEDMYALGTREGYAEAVDRANSGDPFWWAALTVLAYDSQMIVGVPSTSIIDRRGEMRVIGGLSLYPLVYRWEFVPSEDDSPAVIGTLYVPSSDTSAGYAVHDVDEPDGVDGFVSVLHSMLAFESYLYDDFARGRGSSRGDSARQGVLDAALDAMRFMVDRYGMFHST